MIGLLTALLWSRSRVVWVPPEHSVWVRVVRSNPAEGFYAAQQREPKQPEWRGQRDTSDGGKVNIMFKHWRISKQATVLIQYHPLQQIRTSRWKKLFRRETCHQVNNIQLWWRSLALSTIWEWLSVCLQPLCTDSPPNYSLVTLLPSLLHVQGSTVLTRTAALKTAVSPGKTLSAPGLNWTDHAAKPKHKPLHSQLCSSVSKLLGSEAA